MANWKVETKLTQINKESKMFFISDLHFYHELVVKKLRGFDSHEKYNEMIKHPPDS